MPFNIFRLNWILIDVILIFSLVLFLIGVKIFKGLSRWRHSLSNESLVRTNYKKKLKFHYNRTTFKIKKLNLTQNSKYQEQALTRFSIIIIRTNRNKKVNKILTEGLSSYGLNIINMHVKKVHETDLIEENKKNEKFGTAIMKIFANNNKILNSNYVLINYGKSFLSFNFFFSDIHNTGLFLINPRISELNVKNLLALKDFEPLKKHLKFIFSARSNLFLKNLNLKRFKSKIFPHNKDLFKFLIIEKARSSFKYYETILLSKIIFLIDKMNKNFQKK